MKTRIISGLVLAGILLSAIIVGGWYLYFFCLVASLVGMFEFYRVFEMERTPLAWIGYATTVTLYIFTSIGLDHKVEIFLYVISLLVMLGYYVFSFSKAKTDVGHVMTAYFAVFYIGLMLSFVYRLRIMPGGVYAVWLIFIGAWVNDTCAYFVGYFFGKNKMAPELSPKKTVEGALGGIAGATITGLIYGIVVAAVGEGFSGGVVILYTVAALIGAICGIIGDLAASAIKRNRGIKDYGTLIPGHGGILDRFDSVILTAPVVYWIISVIS